MASLVSRERTKKTRSRTRMAAKAVSAQRPFYERRRYGVLYAFFLFVGCSALLALPTTPATLLTKAALLPLGGKMLSLLVGMLAAALLLRCASPDTLRDNRRTLMLCVIALVGCAAAWGVHYLDAEMRILPHHLTPFLLPFVLAPLMAAILDGSVAGIAVGVWSSLFMSVMMIQPNMIQPNSSVATIGLTTFTGGLLATMIASGMAEGVRRRSQVLKSALFSGFSLLLPALAAAAINLTLTTQPMLVLQQTGSAILIGAVVGILALLLLPLFEAVFHRTTNISLLEYSDLSHPLLQRMAIEAPGTYHHSLVVATLSQAAADRIGANSLLTRVCSYFHDIGKLTKPDFFTENQRQTSNPHDELAPSMSTLIITSHVKEGVSLATIHKLPEPIVDVIREHHGTSVITWFHHKARQQLKVKELTGEADGSRVDDGAFRYSGPTPQSRESGIICLADSVEAASRSLDKPNAGHIESLVNDIANKKIADGQLSNCALTLAELSTVKRSFVFTLTNMLHARVPYPKDNEDRDPQLPAPSPAEPADDAKAD